MFGGVAAHAFRPLHYPMTSAIGLGILTAGHRHGWPVAAGGSQSITNAMAALLADLGGKIETGVRIDTAVAAAARRRDDVRPRARGGRRHPRRPAAAPSRARLPAFPPRARRVQGRLRRRGRRAVDQPRPRAGPARCTWRAPSPNSPPPSATSTPGACRSGRSSSSGSSIWPIRSGRSATSTRCGPTRTCPTATPATPPRRSSPRSSDSRPGFRDRIVGQTVRSTTQLAAYNPNFVGGDIMTGAKDIRQLVFGPRITLSPYRIGVPGMYICSAATPPGPGAHGMCGAHAGQAALRDLGTQRQAS